VYLGILDYLREITRHSRLIARRIAPRPAPGEGPFFHIEPVGGTFRSAKRF
jgi:hypothetical protein